MSAAAVGRSRSSKALSRGGVLTQWWKINCWISFGRAAKAGLVFDRGHVDDGDDGDDGPRGKASLNAFGADSLETGI